MRFLELDLMAGGSHFALDVVLIRVDLYGEFELFLNYYLARREEKYLRIKYSMDDYRKEGACGRLAFAAEDWRVMSGRGANRYIYMYACSTASSWHNEVPAKAAGRRGAKVEVESTVLGPLLELSYYVANESIVLESGIVGFLV